MADICRCRLVCVQGAEGSENLHVQGENESIIVLRRRLENQRSVGRP